MALKKSQLYGYLWQSCDELRGGMDASQYKDYVLTLLFVKYVSDRYAGQPDPVIVVPPGGGFADLVALKGNKEIGDQMNVVIAALADANDGFKGVIDLYDFNDENKLGRGQEMVDRLTKLVGIFQELDFRTNRAEGDDLLGDAYEYLMRNFATESGKSKGQFYTPAEVSRVMARIIGIGPQTRQDQTIYDPTCGSGSLLLKAADEAPKGITIYGQENDNATWALARQNMFLHNQPGHEIWKGNTLAAPHFHRDGRLQTFDFVVANPPFSLKNWTSGFDPAHDVFERFEMGVPPAKNGDYAFLLHVIKSLKSAGKAAIILPHGVLFRGNAEGEIRRKIVRQGLIKGIIGLPPNLFYGTGIPACIIVIDKERAHARSGIFIVDASQGYIQDGNKNRLREQDIRKLVDVFNQQLAVPQYSRLVPYSEIAANDYNLNIPRYIDSGAAEDRHDLEAHLHGGIPQGDVDALEPYWAVSPSLRAELFAPGDRPGYLTPRLAPRQLKAAIQANADFAAYAARVEAVFNAWRAGCEPRLRQLSGEDKPRVLIRELADDLLHRFADVALLDPYDIYQRLMDYWADPMQDDMDLIVSLGWREAARPRPLAPERGADKKIRETPDLEVGRQKYKLDLIPPALVVARYFAAERAALEALTTAQEAAAAELEAYLEENASEDGPLAEAAAENSKVSRASVQARLKELRAVPADDEEKAALTRCLALFEARAEAESAVKIAQAALDEKTLARYAILSTDEIKTLVVNDKWLTTLQTAVADEVRRVAQRLTARIGELEARYAAPLPQLTQTVTDLSARVADHLRRMGLQA